MKKSIDLKFDQIYDNLFSYNEVLELNSVDNLETKFGVLDDGVKVAIIGLPFGIEEFDSVVVKGNSLKFNAIDEDVIKKSYFRVYPYNKALENNEPLTRKIEYILNLRAIDMYNNQNNEEKKR